MKLSLSKRGRVRNLSCENEFYLHENKKSFSHQNCNLGVSLFGPTLWLLSGDLVWVRISFSQNSGVRIFSWHTRVQDFPKIENCTPWKIFFSVKVLRYFLPSKSVCRIFYSEVSHTRLKCQMVGPLSTCCFFEVLLTVAMLLKYPFLIPLVEHTPQINKYN